MTLSLSYKPKDVWFKMYSLRRQSSLRYVISFEGDFAERVKTHFLHILPAHERTGTVSFILKEIMWSLIQPVGSAIAYIEALHPFDSKKQAAARTRRLLEAQGTKFVLEESSIYVAAIVEVRSPADLDVLISIWNYDTGISPGVFDIFVSEGFSLDWLGEKTQEMLGAGCGKAGHFLGLLSRYIVSFSDEDNGRVLRVCAADPDRITEAMEIVKSVLDSHGVGLHPSKMK